MYKLYFLYFFKNMSLYFKKSHVKIYSQQRKIKGVLDANE